MRLPAVAMLLLITPGARAATLQVTLGTVPLWGTVYGIIESTNAAAMGGTFAGLPEGATLEVDGTHLRVNYRAGSPHAVELTVVSRPLLVAGIECLNNGWKGLSLEGNAGTNFVTEATTNLPDWTAISTDQPGASGQFQFTDTDAALTPWRFYRARTP